MSKPLTLCDFRVRAGHTREIKWPRVGLLSLAIVDLEAEISQADNDSIRPVYWGFTTTPQQPGSGDLSGTFFSLGMSHLDVGR